MSGTIQIHFLMIHTRAGLNRINPVWSFSSYGPHKTLRKEAFPHEGQTAAINVVSLDSSAPPDAPWKFSSKCLHILREAWLPFLHPSADTQPQHAHTSILKDATSPTPEPKYAQWRSVKNFMIVRGHLFEIGQHVSCDCYSNVSLKCCIEALERWHQHVWALSRDVPPLLPPPLL